MDDLADDQLKLIFMCCHPALAPDAQVALTLRSLCGLSTTEIARGLPRRGGDDGATARPGEAEDPCRWHPLRRSRPIPPARAAVGGAAHRVPRVQRGVRGHRRRRPHPSGAVHRGDPARASPGRSPARRTGGHRPARVDAAARQPTRHPARRARRSRADGRPGPHAVGPRADRCRRGTRRSGARDAACWPLPGGGGDRGVARDRPRGRRHGLDGDRRALRRVAGDVAVAGGRVEPRRCDQHGGRSGCRSGGRRADRRSGSARTVTPAACDARLVALEHGTPRRCGSRLPPRARARRHRHRAALPGATPRRARRAAEGPPG